MKKYCFSTFDYVNLHLHSAHLDDVCFACHRSGPIYVNPGELALVYGIIVASEAMHKARFCLDDALPHMMQYVTL